MKISSKKVRVQQNQLFYSKNTDNICLLKVAFAVFGVSEAVTFKVKLVDPINTIITHLCIKDVIKQYHHHERFFIEIVYEVDFEKTTKIITPFVSYYIVVVNTISYLA